MVESPLLRKKLLTSHKTVHRPSLPASSLTLEALRVLEQELQRREYITLEGFYPLWFHAETERNIFLWRRGCSLIHLDEFSFWIDVPRLIAKRMEQLDTMGGDNPLLNPLWGEVEISDRARDREREYLKDLTSSIEDILHHAHALNYASLEVFDEGEREVVLLPIERLKQRKRTPEP